MKKFTWFCGLLGILFSGVVSASVTIYAASSMTDAMNELIELYQIENKVKITPVYGASSTLARQIEQGAQADVFLSANEQWANYLVEKSLIPADQVQLLVSNELVLITPADNPQALFQLDDAKQWQAQLQNERLAVGQVDSVPVGIYAKEALTNLGVWDVVQPRLAQASNVRAALLLVERGEAPLGIVYKTDAVLTAKVRIIKSFDASTYSPANYPIALLNQQPQSRAFYDFLRSPLAAKVFVKYGFKMQ